MALLPPKRYNQGAAGPLSAYFLADGTGIKVDGSGTGTITLRFDWDDKVNVSGQAVGNLTIGGQVFDQGNNTTGDQTRSFSVTGGNTYTWASMVRVMMLVSELETAVRRSSGMMMQAAA